MTHYIMNGVLTPQQFPVTDQIERLIRSAQRYIKVANFSFAHEGIKTLFIEAMQRGVTLFILGNDPQMGQGEWVDTTEFNANKQNLLDLEDAGGHVRLLLDLHAKFMIVDGQEALLTSCNFSFGCLERNIEAGIMLEPRERQELEHIFESLYMHADVDWYTRQGRSILVRKQNVPINEALFTSVSSSRLRCTIAPRRSDALSACRITALYDEIIRLVTEATEYCYIVSWHFKNPGELNKLIQALQEAIKRGVKVYLYSNISEEQDSNNKAQEALLYLTNEVGCSSYGNDNNHSKCVLNEREGIIFTANIDAQDGLSSGFEVGCLLSDVEHKEALGQIQSLIHTQR